jgi:hypothetical protein
MGKGIIVGILRVALGLDSAEFQDGLAQSGKDGANFAKKLKADIAGAAQQVSAAAAGMKAALAGIGFAGVAAAVSDAAASLAALGDEAKRSGLSVKAFQEWKFVAEQNRIGIDAMTDGFKELSLRADEFVVTGGGSAAEAFQRIGFSAAELRDKLKDPSALMLEIIDRVGKLDKAAQIRIFDELLGGSGGEQFVQLINQGSAGIQKTIDRAHELGRVLSDDVIAKAQELDKRFNEVAATVGTTLKAAIVSVAGTTSTFLDMLNRTQNQALSTLQSRVQGIDAAVAKARTSTLAFIAIGGEEGVNQRLAERLELMKQIAALQGGGSHAGTTVNGPSVPLPTARPEEADKAYEALAAKQAAEREAMAGRLQSLRESLMSEEEAERYSYETRLVDLKTYFDNKMITQAEYDELSIRAHQDMTQQLGEITKRGVDEEMRMREQLVGNAADIFGSLATIASTMGEKGFIAAKAFGIAEAVINTAQGITKALAQGGVLGFVGAAAVAAAGAAQIATIASTNPGSSKRPSVNGGAAPAAAAAIESAVPQQAVALHIEGDVFSKDSVEELMRQMVELQKDGHKLVLV